MRTPATARGRRLRRARTRPRAFETCRYITNAVDNLTHTLFGLTLARTPLGRAGRGVTTALVLASNAPDVDFVIGGRGGAAYLQWHRGPTHGPLGVLVLGALVAVLVRGGQRLFGRPRAADDPESPFSMLLAASLIGVVCHILMDF